MYYLPIGSYIEALGKWVEFEWVQSQDLKVDPDL